VWAHLPGHPNHVWWANTTNEWVWSPLTVSGEPCGLGNEQPEMLSTPHMISDVGLKWSLPMPLRFPCSISCKVQDVRPLTLLF
jgi:hypothetical protein